MQRAAAKIAPKLLNFEQKQRRMDIAQDMLTTFNDEPDLLQNVITGEESWVYGYGIKADAQSFRKIETEAVGDTKKRVSEVLRGLETTLA